MNSLRAIFISVSTLAAALTLSGGAFAQSTWTLKPSGSGGSCGQGGANSGTYNNSWSCTGTTAPGNTAAGTSGPVSLSAWSSDRGTNRYAKTGGSTYSANSDGSVNSYYTAGGTGTNTRYHQQLTGTGFASAYLSPQGSSGFGAASRDEGVGSPSPNHAFDSTLPGTVDLLLLSFNSSVILSQIGIGWTGGDSDITLMRWNGAGAPTRTAGTTLVGGNENLASTLGSQGWELVGSYDNLVVNSPISTGADPEKGSSWWLISSFNTALNGGSNNCLKAGKASTCDQGDDSFKLNFVATLNPVAPPPGGSVPEPGSLALAGLAIAGVFGVRRRSVKPV
jgi:hypothetical protein